ncbi:carbohydrate-binding protein [Paenibacillus antri]|uniref:Carbohydrate-binding protein n=1 Tax=Paenibacillus antri TaxID=2582848 RepID=A0A5R9GEA3_9BACL|nr:glycoside hydrolase family 3 protein [Paenibacillus antri]TLS53459.1 carbohydrate-binding protein [Paenibacillus antri]
MTAKTTETYPFQNPDSPLDERVNDLVSRFTLDEKVNLMCQYQDEVPRLGVGAYKHGTEAAHGVAWLGEATSFPQPIGLSCTWDEALLRKIGSIIGDEARGFYARDPKINGLTLWAPTVDMERDPRWGRTEEAYGEDPYLAGKLSAALVQGLQGDHPLYVKTVASLKHFYANNNEIDRGTCSISIDPRNKREYYLKAFELPFKEGGALSMMTAYNAVNGVPANVNPEVRDIVKGEWGMSGFVVSDAGDVTGTVDDHGYSASYKEAVALTIKAGVDSITDDHPRFKEAIREALADGLLAESDLDVALRNAFRVRFRLGEFDPERNPYASIDESVILRPEHAALSREAARKGVVLLKNEGGALPLQGARLGKVAVVGPLGGIVYRDWYSGTLPYSVTPADGIAAKLSAGDVVFRGGTNRVALRSTTTGKYVRLGDGDAALAATAVDAANASVLETTDWGWDSHTIVALENGKYLTTNDELVSATSTQIWEWFTKEVFHLRRTANGDVTLTTWNDRPVVVDADSGALRVVDGSKDDAETFAVEVIGDGLQEAVEAAASADAAIVFVGNHPLVNGKETIDRPDITLAASQERLIQEVYRANPNTTVVVVGSYPYAFPWADANVPAILYSSHAGQELGNAIADVLFGDFNPAGRLSMTWYKSVDQLPAFLDYDIIKGNRTYRYFEGEPLYPFGYGLSYSRFEYDNLALDRERLGADDVVTVRFRVMNNSDVAGEEVPQLYARALRSRVKRPNKELHGFRRIALAAGESAEVTFELKAADLAFWDVTRDRYCVESGEYEVMVGASSADIRLTASFAIDGETVPPRDLYRATSAANYDDYAGVFIGEGPNGGDCVVVDDPSAGAWIRFDDVELGEGAGANGVELVAAAAAPAAFEVRLDAPDGPIAASGTVEGAEGAKPAWRAFAAAATGASGRRSVYVTLRGPARVAAIRFLK